MASPDALKALIEALEGEQARRQSARFGGQDPHTVFANELEMIAQRFAATAPLGVSLDTADMSLVEKLACHLLPEGLQPAGLPAEDELWDELKARASG